MIRHVFYVLYQKGIMNNQTNDQEDLQQEINYFTQKFRLSKNQVQEAIQKVGKSSENLEQYFQEMQMKHTTGGLKQSPGDRTPSL